MKRDLKSGKFSKVVDDKATTYIKENLRSGEKGVPIKIAQYLTDTYGISFLYAYQLVLKVKNEKNKKK